MPLRIPTFCVLLVALQLTPLPTIAEPQPTGASESLAYRQAVESALAEFELGNYAEAREHFRVAHAHAPSARTFRGLGIAEFELRNYPESVQYLEKALASTMKPLTPEMRRQVEEVLHRARGYVGEVSVSVSPTTADVTVNGQPAEIAAAPLLLPVGDHVIELSATGFATQRRSISIKGREQRTVRVELVPLSTAEPGGGASARDDRSAEQSPVYTRWWLWTAIGVVAAAGVTAGILIPRYRQESDFKPSLTANVPDEIRGGLPIPAAR